MLTLTKEQQSALHCARGVRRVWFRYRITSAFGAPKLAPEVAYGLIGVDAGRPVTRTGQFVIRDDARIDFTNDFLDVFMCASDGKEEYEWPLGRFFMPTATRTGTPKSYWREIEAYDAAYALLADEYVNIHRVGAGTPYLSAVREALSGGGAYAALDECPKRLSESLEWEAGTPRLTVINDLLAAIEFEPLWADASGRFVARENRSAGESLAQYAYRADGLSVLTHKSELHADVFSLPNVFRGVVSRPGGAMTYTAQIDDPANPLSATARGGRRLLSVIRLGDSADYETLVRTVERARDEAARGCTRVKFETLTMPHHEVRDVYSLSLEGETPVKYFETAWSMELAAGAVMKHTAQRAVLPLNGGSRHV